MSPSEVDGLGDVCVFVLCIKNDGCVIVMSWGDVTGYVELFWSGLVKRLFWC